MGIENFVLQNAGQRFLTKDLNDLLKPGVYVIMKAGIPIYVGMGKNLLRRVSGNHHKRNIIQDSDEVLLYPCVSEYAATELEAELISKFQPTYNERLLLSKKSKLLGYSTTSALKSEYKSIL